MGLELPKELSDAGTSSHYLTMIGNPFGTLSRSQSHLLLLPVPRHGLKCRLFGVREYRTGRSTPHAVDVQCYVSQLSLPNPGFHPKYGLLLRTSNDKNFLIGIGDNWRAGYLKPSLKSPREIRPPGSDDLPFF